MLTHLHQRHLLLPLLAHPVHRFPGLIHVRRRTLSLCQRRLEARMQVLDVFAHLLLSYLQTWTYHRENKKLRKRHVKQRDRQRREQLRMELDAERSIKDGRGGALTPTSTASALSLGPVSTQHQQHHLGLCPHRLRLTWALWCVNRRFARQFSGLCKPYISILTCLRWLRWLRCMHACMV